MNNTVLELSTGHITEKDSKELHRMVAEEMSGEEMGSPFTIGESRYGFFILVPSDEEAMVSRSEVCEEKGYQMSEDFWGVIEYAIKNGHRVILLDCDADEVDQLPVHSW